MIKPPSLPLAPQEWNQRFQQEYSRVLRLFFTAITALRPVNATSLTLTDPQYAATLVNAVTDLDTVFEVSDPDLFPNTGYGTINFEKFYWDGKSGAQLLNVQRGQLGTTAASHNTGDLIVASAETGVIYVNPLTNALYRVF